jgi:bacillithiol synthase
LYSNIPFGQFYSHKSIAHQYINNSEKLFEILPNHFLNEGEYAKQAHRLLERKYSRNILCEVLEEQNRLFNADDSTFLNIDKLNKDDAFVVIAGQQVGLFSGPLYTIHKILSVIKLAKELSDKLKKNVAPVFWMATDDHDYPEINHIYLLDQGGNTEKIVLTNEENNPKLPISSINISSEITALIEQLKTLLPNSEFSSQIFDTLEHTYKIGVSFSIAFGSLIQSVFKKYGLILIDPSDPKLKKIAVPLFAKEIKERSPVSEAVLQQTELIEKEGFSAQIKLHKNILNLFYHDPGREAIFFNENEFFVKNGDQKFSKIQLLQLLEEHPEKFSPNAVMRPLYQDTLFPTLAFVLGPSELAYFAQLKLAYEKMGIPVPIAFPRTSITLIEPRAKRLLKKYQLTFQEIFNNKDHVLDDLIKKEIPESLFENIESGSKRVEQIWQEIQNEITGFDPNMIKPAEIAASKSIGQFDFLNKKLMQSARKKNEVIKSQIEKLLNLLLPLGKPQERVFNFLPYYIRFGEYFIDHLYSQIDVFNPDHQVISLEMEQKDS